MTDLAIAGGGMARIRRNSARARLGTARGTAPVRRDSVSSEELDNFTRRMSKAERMHLLKAVRAWNEANRGKGGRMPLTASTVHVLGKMLFEFMDWNTGLLDHAYSWMAKRSNRVYETLGFAIAQLEHVGILERQRRCRRGDGPDGPAWVQDTNLYRFRLPEKIQTWWNEQKAKRDAKARARMPDDALVAEKARKTENAAAEKAWYHQVAEKMRAAAQARREATAAGVQGPGAAAYRARHGLDTA